MESSYSVRWEMGEWGGPDPGAKQFEPDYPSISKCCMY